MTQSTITPSKKPAGQPLKNQSSSQQEIYILHKWEKLSKNGLQWKVMLGLDSMYQVNKITLQGASWLHSCSAMMLNSWWQKRQAVTIRSLTSNKTAEDTMGMSWKTSMELWWQKWKIFSYEMWTETRWECQSKGHMNIWEQCINKRYVWQQVQKNLAKNSYTTRYDGLTTDARMWLTEAWVGQSLGRSQLKQDTSLCQWCKVMKSSVQHCFSRQSLPKKASEARMLIRDWPTLHCCQMNIQQSPGKTCFTVSSILKLFCASRPN